MQRTSKATPRLAVFDDGYGDDVSPPEPDKRWLTIATVVGGVMANEVAVLVSRGGEPSPEQHEWAALIVKAVNAHDELVKALSNLLDQLEGVGIYIEGVDEGQWAGTEGLSFAEASAALAKARASVDIAGVREGE